MKPTKKFWILMGILLFDYLLMWLNLWYTEYGSEITWIAIGQIITLVLVDLGAGVVTLIYCGDNEFFTKKTK